VELACVVTGVARQISRRDGAEWGKVTVEDFHGTATVLAFKEVWQTHKEKLRQDAVVLIRGSVSGRERDEEDPPIFLDEVLPLEELERSGQLAVQIELEAGTAVLEEAFASARTVLAAHPGASPVELTLGSDNGVKAPRFRSRTLTAAPTAETLAALRELFGKGNVRLVKR
jgi:DNA polymerase-3 subunit alpha